MAPKEMTIMMETSLANIRHDEDDSSSNDGVAADSRTVSLDLSFGSSMMSIVTDDTAGGDGDDEEMGRTRTRDQNHRLKENDDSGRIDNNIQHFDRQFTEGQDEKRPVEDKNDAEAAENNKQDTTISEIIYKAWIESHWAFQVAVTILSCFWTYALINGKDGDDGDSALNWDAQIVIMVVLVLTGVACPINLFAPVGVGVFAGAVSRSVVPTYTALLVLSIVSAVVWRVVAYTQFLIGFGGRMGTTTFLAMNMTAVFFLIPFGLMQDGWHAYGSPKWTTTGSDNNAGFFEWDKAVVLVCSTTFLSVAGASFRIQATASQKGTTVVHPFLTPCAVALASDLVVAAAAATTTGNRLASTAYLGFSVGSYVAMAVLTKKLPNKDVDFLPAGVVAGLMGVLIEPFFVDFAGKAGFTAFLGYSTYKYIIMPLVQLMLLLLTCNEPKPE